MLEIIVKKSIPPREFEHSSWYAQLLKWRTILCHNASHFVDAVGQHRPVVGRRVGVNTVKTTRHRFGGMFEITGRNAWNHSEKEHSSS
jgi:hypothetical protein